MYTIISGRYSRGISRRLYNLARCAGVVWRSQYCAKKNIVSRTVRFPFIRVDFALKRYYRYDTQIKNLTGRRVVGPPTNCSLQRRPQIAFSAVRADYFDSSSIFFFYSRIELKISVFGVFHVFIFQNLSLQLFYTHRVTHNNCALF